MSGDRMSYPAMARVSKIISFEHGAQIIDPYQWLEETNSQAVTNFLTAQSTLTTNYLQSCDDTVAIKKMLHKRIEGTTVISCPVESSNGNYYFCMKDGEDDYDSLFIQEGLKGKPRLFISPRNIKCFARDKYVLRMYALSLDGQVLAYAFSSSVDSPWFYVRFKDAKTGVDFQETLQYVRDSDISWTHDSKGILYSCYLTPDTNDEQNTHKIVFHSVGTKQEEDFILIEFPNNPTSTLQARISDCGETIFVYAHEKVNEWYHNYLLYGDLKPTIADNYETCPVLHHLVDGVGMDIQYITTIDDAFYFRTNIRAPNFRIVKALLFHHKITRGLWETIIPEDHKRLLDWAIFVNRHAILICYVEEATHKLELRSIVDGKLLHRYPIPIGTITEYSCSGREVGDINRVFFTFSSFLLPDCVRYIQIPKHLNLTIYDKFRQCAWSRKFKNIKNFQKNYTTRMKNESRYLVKQRFCVNGKDGTAIPMFLIHKKDIRLDGQSPCMVYGQGCFGVQIMPSFCISKIAFVQCFNGVVAIVGVRGGGEHGKKWYHDGIRGKKQRAYDDLIAACEYLTKLGYTSSSRLILEGELFGGNLAATCMLQRPDLFGAVIIHDGLLDLLRYHKFKESEELVHEFGDPEIVHIYDFLLKIAPLPNALNENTMRKIPAVMVLVGSEPSHIHPSNSYKFIAELQHSLAAKSKKKNPFLLRVAGNESRLKSKIEERCDIFAFLIRTLGLKFTDR